ncbi:MAG: CmcI family methyltransferase [Limnohabitans sp.]
MFKALGHWLKQIFGSSQPDQPGTASLQQAESNSQMAEQFESIDEASQLVPYDENLLERARTQWQFGDWHSLAKLDRDTLHHHPDRAKLVLLAAAGRLQLGQTAEARQYLRLAQDWGCGRQLISQVLISGVHNTIGMAAAIGGHQQRSALHFDMAIRIGSPGSDLKLLTKVRLGHQVDFFKIPEISKPEIISVNSLEKNKEEKNLKLKQELIELRNQREKINRENTLLENLLFKKDLPSIYKSIEEYKNILLKESESITAKLKHTIDFNWIKKDVSSWLHNNIQSNKIEFTGQPFDILIEYIAKITNRNGALPLWAGYNQVGGEKNQEARFPNQVRVGSSIGSFFTWITRKRKPDYIAEIGSAYGVSGMYWAAGIEINGKGKFITFEANELWQPIAHKNIGLITSKFSSFCGAVENNFNKISLEDGKIDILFIDAIHKKEEVNSQLMLFKPYLRSGSLVIIDDINFSNDMKNYWDSLAVEKFVMASIEVKGRLGIIEYKE